MDTTPLSVQFEHQLLMRQDWGSGWNMPRTQHTCRETAQHTSATYFISCFLCGDKLQQEHHFSSTQQQLLAMIAVLYVFQHLF